MASLVAAGATSIGAPRGSATVSVDPDAKPDRATHVRLERFDGPLALLVSLIEQRELDILDVPLGDLCGAYLEAISTLGDEQMPHISSFISVCSQLILIKSRALLPRPTAPDVADADSGGDPEEELRARLIVYKRFRDAGIRLAARLESGTMALAHRDASVASAAGAAGARAPQEPPLDPELLVAALVRALRLVPPPPPLPEVIRREVTLAERAAIIRSALRRTPIVVLQELLRGVTDRVVVAVTFLAMLELVKSRELVVEQGEPWGPIVCRAPSPAP
ncbi:MAG: segregation/condensation protein A [Chloroflexi bacterium]|nr:segregation/condensation protein A [Chloroflexota bacterium]